VAATCVSRRAVNPQVLFHAIRNLTRVARGTATIRWSQDGFGRTSSTTSDQSTPRNLMGFKDGTNDLLTDSPIFAKSVWVDADDDPDWMTDGSYLVARRIRILIETWDRSSLKDQEATIGRQRATGAPLGARTERDPIDLDATGTDGQPLIPTRAHVRQANQQAQNIHILRRGYNFTNGLALSSCRCRPSSPRTTRSTSTSATWAQPSSRSRRASPPGNGSDRRCSAEQGRPRVRHSRGRSTSSDVAPTDELAFLMHGRAPPTDERIDEQPA
jgi:deferrochelatase/peroxidase EfeB